MLDTFSNFQKNFSAYKFVRPYTVSFLFWSDSWINIQHLTYFLFFHIKVLLVYSLLDASLLRSNYSSGRFVLKRWMYTIGCIWMMKRIVKYSDMHPGAGNMLIQPCYTTVQEPNVTYLGSCYLYHLLIMNAYWMTCM